MNVYTCTDFRGHWPVGVSAVIVASDKQRAAKHLESELKKSGLEQAIDTSQLKRVSTRKESVSILQNGEY